MNNLIYINQAAKQYHVLNFKKQIERKDTVIHTRMVETFSVNPPNHFAITTKQWLNEAVTKRKGETWVDVYIFGCVHNSTTNPFRGKGIWNRPIPLAPSENTLENIIAHLKKNKINKVNIGRKSDALMFMDNKYSCTLYFLRRLQKEGIQYTIYTMSDLCAHEEYRDLCKNKTMMRLPYESDAPRDKDVGAPSPKRRLKAVKVVNAKIIKGWYA